MQIYDIFFSFAQNKTMIYNGYISDISVPWQFQLQDTKHYLRKFITGPEEAGPVDFAGKAVSVSPQEFTDWKQAGNTIDSFAEFCLLCEQTSEYLLRHDRCIFHSVAISFEENAWLIAAGSGVGKSTLCKSLMESHPSEIQVINGDKPALQYIENEGILVHPSPWNGKEGLHGAPKAPLAGIFLLRRGTEDSISVAKEVEAIIRIYLNIFQECQDEKTIKAAGTMTEHIIKSCPIWLLTSQNVAETTHLLYQTMRKELGCEL